MIRNILVAGTMVVLTATFNANPAVAEAKKLVLGTPGIPPIFAATLPIVADKMGFFKKYGADVEVKFMESGTAAARALVSGDVDLALAPTPQVTAQASNAGVDFVGIYGLPHPDFLLASTDPKKASCKDVIGQSVGVDAINGARAVALRIMLGACGVKPDEVKQIALPSVATQQAMIAHSITFGILHIDEIPALERQGTPVTVVTSIRKASPNSHFAMITVRGAALKADRQAYVRVIAGVIAAARFMKDPKNADKFGELATVTGRTKEEAMSALEKLEAIGFFPADDDGLDRKQIESVIAGQVKSGNIKPDKAPVKFDSLIDPTVWRDAAALVAKSPGGG
jgi:ABC-type nitrate/sulfonate/bicarbonate transport system substrate-binding protein